MIPRLLFGLILNGGEGGLQMLHLFIFFILLVLLFRDEKSWRKMLIIFILAAFWR